MTLTVGRLTRVITTVAGLAALGMGLAGTARAEEQINRYDPDGDTAGSRGDDSFDGLSSDDGLPVLDEALSFEMPAASPRPVPTSRDDDYAG